MRVFVAIISILFIISLNAEEKKQKIKFPLKFNPKIHKNLKKLKKNVVKKKKADKKDEKKVNKKKDRRSSRKKARKAPQRKPVRRGASLRAPDAKNVQNLMSNSASRSEEAKEVIKIESSHSKPFNKNAKFHLDFPNTPLEDVIKFFSEKTGRNFIVQDRLAKTKITIMSPRKVTVREAFRTFLTLLAVNNISVVRDGKFYIIMNERDISSTKIDIFKQDEIPGVFRLVAAIIKFKYVDAADMDKLLKIFRDKGGQSYVFDDKTLILIDYAANIRKMMEITRELDVPSDTDSAKLHFVKLKHIAPSDAKKLIDDIFKDYRKQSRRRRGKRRRHGTNTPNLIGVAKDARKKEKKSEKSAEDEAVEALSSMYLHIVADDRSEQMILLCSQETYSLILQIIKKMDREVEGEGEIHVVKLQNAKAKDLVKTLNTLSKNKRSRRKGRKKGNEVFEGEVNISADESTNSLVIVSSFRDFKNLKRVIEHLDIKRKQVFVEAVIMEVNVSESLGYGLGFASFGFEQQLFGEDVPIFFAKTFSQNATSGFLSGLLGPALSGTDEIGGMVSPTGKLPLFGLLLNAMKNDSNMNVMSTPHILTTDNEEAEIIVGETIPFPSGSITTSTVGSQVSYKREDVALKLKIKPQINESGYMTLEVNQEVTELGENTEYGYRTTKRSAKTIINAENEQTVVIGGLIRDVVREAESKIPLLGDIPVIGNLFKYTNNSTEKVNLLIILTPHIIEGKKDFDRILNDKLKEREQFAKKFYGEITDFEPSVMYEKKRGALLSITKLLDEDAIAEKNEIELIKQRNKKRALIISPDGKEKEIEMKNGTSLKDYSDEMFEEEEEVPPID